MWELRGEYRRVGEERGKVRKWTDVPLHESSKPASHPSISSKRNT
jgi:hypothetical protein